VTAPPSQALRREGMHFRAPRRSALQCGPTGTPGTVLAQRANARELSPGLGRMTAATDKYYEPETG